MNHTLSNIHHTPFKIIQIILPLCLIFTFGCGTTEQPTSESSEATTSTSNSKDNKKEGNNPPSNIEKTDKPSPTNPNSRVQEFLAKQKKAQEEQAEKIRKIKEEMEAKEKLEAKLEKEKVIAKAKEVDPETEAKKLLETASGIIKTVKANAKSYSVISTEYKKAKASIDLILSKYKSTNTHRRLIGGQNKIGKLRFDKFKSLDKLLTSISNAEKSPIECAKLVAKTSKSKKTLLKTINDILDNKSNEKKMSEKERNDFNVNSLLEKGLLDKAYSISKELTSRVLSDKTFESLAIKLSEVKKFTEGVEMAVKRTKSPNQSRLLIKLIKLAEKNNTTINTKSISEFYNNKDKTKILISTLKGNLKALATSFSDDSALQCEKIVELIENKSYKAFKLVQISKLYLKNKNVAKSNVLLAKAFQVANTMRSSKGQNKVFASIAYGYAKTKDYPNLLVVGNKLINHNDIDKENEERDQYFLEISKLCAIDGQFKKVLILAQKVYRKDAFDYIVSISAEKGYLDQGIQISNLLKSDYKKAMAFAKLAHLYGKKGDNTKAADLINKALDCNKKVKYFQYKVFSEIAVAYYTINQDEKASAIIQEATKTSPNFKNNGSGIHSRITLLTYVSLKLYFANDKEKGDQLFKQAMELSKLKPLFRIRKQTLSEMAKLYLDAGNLNNVESIAKSIGSKAENSTQTNLLFRDNTLINLSRVYLKNSKNAKALAIASTLAKKNESASKLMIDIARSFFQSGNKKKSLEILLQAIDFKRPLPGNRILSLISKTYADFGEFEKGLELIKSIKRKDKASLSATGYIVIKYTAVDFEKGIVEMQSLPDKNKLGGTISKNDVLKEIVKYNLSKNNSDLAIKAALKMPTPLLMNRQLIEISKYNINLGHYQKAIKALSGVNDKYPDPVSSSPTKKSLLNKIANICIDSSDYDSALMAAVSLKDRSSRSKLLNTIIINLAKSKNFSRALEVTSQYLKENKTLVIALVNIGKIREKSNQALEESSIKSLQKIIIKTIPLKKFWY